MQPFVSIIIPTYKDWDRLERCLEALESQSYPESRFEVIVVNNDPEEDFPEAIKERRAIRLHERRPGSYAARNTGLKRAKGELIGFTDSDCIPDPNWISNAVSTFEESPTVDRIGGRIDIFFADQKPTSAELYELVFAFRQEETIARNGRSVTANLFTRKSVIDEVGKFDGSLFSGGDLKWSEACGAAGKKTVYSEQAIVKHPARGSLKQLFTKRKRTLYGRFDSGGLNEKRTFSVCMRGLLPPMGLMPMIWQKTHRRVWPSIQVFAVAYLLKLHFELVLREIKSRKKDSPRT